MLEDDGKVIYPTKVNNNGDGEDWGCEKRIFVTGDRSLIRNPKANDNRSTAERRLPAGTTGFVRELEESSGLRFKC